MPTIRQRRDGSVFLVPDNPGFETIELAQETETVWWGVESSIIAQPRVR
jgi:hypothetical protein